MTIIDPSLLIPISECHPLCLYLTTACWTAGIVEGGSLYKYYYYLKSDPAKRKQVQDPSLLLATTSVLHYSFAALPCSVLSVSPGPGLISWIPPQQPYPQHVVADQAREDTVKRSSHRHQPRTAAALQSKTTTSAKPLAIRSKQTVDNHLEQVKGAKQNENKSNNNSNQKDSPPSLHVQMMHQMREQNRSMMQQQQQTLQVNNTATTDTTLATAASNERQTQQPRVERKDHPSNTASPYYIRPMVAETTKMNHYHRFLTHHYFKTLDGIPLPTPMAESMRRMRFLIAGIGLTAFVCQQTGLIIPSSKQQQPTNNATDSFSSGVKNSNLMAFNLTRGINVNYKNNQHIPSVFLNPQRQEFFQNQGQQQHNIPSNSGTVNKVTNNNMTTASTTTSPNVIVQADLSLPFSYVFRNANMKNKYTTKSQHQVVRDNKFLTKEKATLLSRALAVSLLPSSPSDTMKDHRNNTNGTVNVYNDSIMIPNVTNVFVYSDDSSSSAVDSTTLLNKVGEHSKTFWLDGLEALAMELEYALRELFLEKKERLQQQLQQVQQGKEREKDSQQGKNVIDSNDHNDYHNNDDNHLPLGPETPQEAPIKQEEHPISQEEENSLNKTTDSAFVPLLLPRMILSFMETFGMFIRQVGTWSLSSLLISQKQDEQHGNGDVLYILSDNPYLVSWLLQRVSLLFQGNSNNRGFIRIRSAAENTHDKWGANTDKSNNDISNSSKNENNNDNAFVGRVCEIICLDVNNRRDMDQYFRGIMNHDNKNNGGSSPLSLICCTDEDKSVHLVSTIFSLQQKQQKQQQQEDDNNDDNNIEQLLGERQRKSSLRSPTTDDTTTKPTIKRSSSTIAAAATTRKEEEGARDSSKSSENVSDDTNDSTSGDGNSSPCCHNIGSSRQKILVLLETEIMARVMEQEIQLAKELQQQQGQEEAQEQSDDSLPTATATLEDAVNVQTPTKPSNSLSLLSFETSVLCLERIHKNLLDEIQAIIMQHHQQKQQQHLVLDGNNHQPTQQMKTKTTEREEVTAEFITKELRKRRCFGLCEKKETK